MIYTEIKEEFDDTIIRAADALINASYFDQRYYFYTSDIPKRAQSSEFRTVSLSLPRRCGKTTYLAKLANHFRNHGKSVIVFTPRLEMARNEPWTNVAVSYASVSPERRFSADIILYDEVFDFDHFGDDFTISLHTKV